MEPVQINDPEVISLTFTIVKLLLGGILLGLLFSFYKYALSLFPGDIANNKTLNRIILFTKLASWSVFIIYAVEQIFYNYPMAGRIATVILLFMVIGISWQIIREFILGVLVKFEGSYPVNRRVKIKKIEGKKKSISAFFKMQASEMESGIASEGGVVAELDADVIIASSTDVLTSVDKTGRRWAPMEFLTGDQWKSSKMKSVFKDLDKLIGTLVKKHLSHLKPKGDVYGYWQNMKTYLKDDGKKLRKRVSYRHMGPGKERNISLF